MEPDCIPVIRTPVPLPARYTDAQQAVIEAAIAVESPVRVNRGGTLHEGPQGECFAVFGSASLAYRLECARCVSNDGFAWEIIPALMPGAVGCWRRREAGRILHLVRDLFIDGAFVVGATWEPAWIASPWIGLRELTVSAAQEKEMARSVA
jgi:hypothetical protein